MTDSRGTLSGDFGEPTTSEPDQAGAEEGLTAPDLDVDRELGRGGMGIVWLARQRCLGRPVAVKTLRPELVGGPAATKFEAEALVTGRLDHPNVPPVHFYGRDDAGRPYLCMKLVKGVEWARLLEPQTDEERARAAKHDLRAHLEILRRVCDAVSYAHDQGIVHRDLKPENVMVGAYGEVLVMDWGIAREISGAGANTVAEGLPDRASGEGPRNPIGTPAYMPPEMADRRDEALGPPTDVYLLGGILYEILTGTPPHRGEGVLETLLAARAGDVEPPAARAPGRPIPEALAEIAMKALEKDPARRYASPRDLAAAVDEFQRHESSRALAEFGLSELAAAEAVVALGAAPPGSLYGRFAGAAAALAQAADSWPGNRAAREGLARARVAYASYAIENGDLALAEAELERAGPDAPGAKAVRARLAQLLAGRAADATRRRRLAVGLVLAIVVVALTAAGLVRQARRADQAEAARLLRERAVAETVGAEWSEAEDRMKGAEMRAAAYERALAIDPSWLEGYRERARAYMEIANGSEWGEAAAFVELARSVMEKALEIAPHDLQSLADRAYIAMVGGDWKRARPLYEECARADPAGRLGLRAAALIALDDGRAGDAIAAIERIRRSELSADDYFVRGIAHYILGDVDGAQADAARAQKTSPNDSWYVALGVLARLARGDALGAGDDLRQSLKDDPHSPHLLPLLAYRAAVLGDRPRAEALLERARAAHAGSRHAYLTLEPFFAAAARAPAPRDGPAKAILLDVPIDRLLPRRPAPSLVLRREGEDLLAAGDYRGAIAAATRALGEDSADGAARLIRGRAFAALDHGPAARHDLEVVETLAPERAAEARAALAALEAGGE